MIISPLQGIIMIFAVNDQQSFLNIRKWLQNIEDVRYICTLYIVHQSVTSFLLFLSKLLLCRYTDLILSRYMYVFRLEFTRV